MLVTQRPQAGVAVPPVGVHDRAGGSGGLHERAERVARGILDHPEPQATRAGPVNLNRDADERLLAARTTARAPLLQATEVELVDLNLALERLALGRDHRAPQLVQHHPRGLVTADSELALQLLGRDPRMMRGNQIGRPEPRPQRLAGAVHQRARRDRRLRAAALALPHQPAPMHRPDLAAAAAPAAEPVGPARRKQVGPARLLVGEALLELHDRQRESGLATPPSYDHPQTERSGYALVRLRGSAAGALA